MRPGGLSGISPPFGGLSPTTGQVTHVLLTRSPLKSWEASSPINPLDLHVLGTPPAFVLSQDQTLHKDFIAIGPAEGPFRLVHLP